MHLNTLLLETRFGAPSGVMRLVKAESFSRKTLFVCGRRPLINAAILSLLLPASCLEVHLVFSYQRLKKNPNTIKYIHTPAPQCTTAFLPLEEDGGGR